MQTHVDGNGYSVRSASVGAIRAARLAGSQQENPMLAFECAEQHGDAEERERGVELNVTTSNALARNLEVSAPRCGRTRRSILIEVVNEIDAFPPSKLLMPPADGEPDEPTISPPSFSNPPPTG